MMKITFLLAWLKKGIPARRGFKSEEAYRLFAEYAQRISKFTACRIEGGVPPPQRSALTVWMCDTSKAAKPLSSEDLARRLEKTQEQGFRELLVVIGGAEGFSAKDYDLWKPDLRWNFGPLTLPHELAAVVASEQIYRAWTILKRLPYHCGHL